MTIQELELLQSQRLEGETIIATKERLQQEGKLESESYPVATIEDREEDLFSDDLVIPRFKIVQPSSRLEDVEIGQFYNTVTGECQEQLENVAFLSKNQGRILFPQGDFSGVRECWTWNGCTPAREEIIAKTGNEPKSYCCVRRENGQKIVVCPFAQWNNDEKVEGSRSPKCKETYSFIGINSSFAPFSISFHGTGIPIVKKFLSSIYLKRKEGLLKGKNLHLWSFKLTISLKLQVSDRGKFYYPCFSNVEEVIEDKEFQLLARFASRFAET